MKVCLFHLMPYRDLAPDFDQRYKSAYIDPVWFDVADPRVSESDAAAEEYAPHVEYFSHKLLYTPQYYQATPGYQDHESLVLGLKAPLRERFDLRALKYKDFVERGFLIAGSAATCCHTSKTSGTTNGTTAGGRNGCRPITPSPLRRPPNSEAAEATA